LRFHVQPRSLARGRVRRRELGGAHRAGGSLRTSTRVTRYDRDIDMGYRYGISDINEISIWVSIWNVGYRCGMRYIDMVIHHIDMVILDIDM
jgi:hypothetical protein